MMADWDFYTVVDGYVGPLAVDAAAKEATEVATGQTPATSPGASQIPERPEELRWEVQGRPSHAGSLVRLTSFWVRCSARCCAVVAMWT